MGGIDRPGMSGSCIYPVYYLQPHNQMHVLYNFTTTTQVWGQSTRYFGTLVLEYRFCSTRRYSVLVLLKSTCTRTCTQVLLKIKVLLTSTYEYFTSTSHIKLILEAHRQILNHYCRIWDI